MISGLKDTPGYILELIITHLFKERRHVSLIRFLTPCPTCSTISPVSFFLSGPGDHFSSQSLFVKPLWILDYVMSFHSYSWLFNPSHRSLYCKLQNLFSLALILLVVLVIPVALLILEVPAILMIHVVSVLFFQTCNS